MRKSSGLSPLSEPQLKIALCWLAGLSIQAIACELKISSRCVKRELKALEDRLQDRSAHQRPVFLPPERLFQQKGCEKKHLHLWLWRDWRCWGYQNFQNKRVTGDRECQ